MRVGGWGNSLVVESNSLFSGVWGLDPNRGIQFHRLGMGDPTRLLGGLMFESQWGDSGVLHGICSKNSIFVSVIINISL